MLKILFNKENRLLSTIFLLLLINSVIILFLFGITFFTIFWSGFSLFLFFILLIKRLYEQNKSNLKLVVFYKLLLSLLILGVMSFIIIEGVIIAELLKPDAEITTDYLLVLGGGVRGETPSVVLQDRLDKALEYLKEDNDIIVIVSGGLGRKATITEAEAMKRFLVANGVDSQRIIKEERATSTNQNIKFSKDILTEIGVGPDYKLNLLTSDFHSFRARYIAEKRGLEVYPIRAGTDFWVRSNYLIREYFALIKTLIFDISII